MEKQLTEKNRAFPPLETMYPTSHMEEETIEENLQEMWELKIGEEEEDMDIGYMDLEGIEKSYADKGKGYVPHE